MSDETRPRRPILKLKIDVAPRLPPEPPPAPKPSRPSWVTPRREPRPPPAPVPAAPQHDWKCKPCGTAFTPAGDLGDEDAVRCPSCNARLGRATDFRADPPRLEKLRARQVKRA